MLYSVAFANPVTLFSVHTVVDSERRSRQVSSPLLRLLSMTNDALQRSHDKNVGKPSVLGRKTVMRRLLLCTTLCALYLFAVSTYPMAQGLDPSRTPSMAGTPSTEETANLDPLDFKSAMPFISDDGVIEIQLPAGWRPDNPSRNGYYGFSYTARPNDKANTTVAFVIVLGNLGDIYNVLTGRTDPAIDSPETLLAELKNTLPVTISSGDVQRAKIGKLHAFSLETYGPALQLASATTQIRVTRL